MNVVMTIKMVLQPPPPPSVLLWTLMLKYTVLTFVQLGPANKSGRKTKLNPLSLAALKRPSNGE